MHIPIKRLPPSHRLVATGQGLALLSKIEQEPEKLTGVFDTILAICEGTSPETA